MTKLTNELNNDLAKIIACAFQSKINSNPDPTKQAQEVIFSQKLQNGNSILNHNTVSLTESQKHLGIIVLDSRLDFKENLEITFKKVSKTIALIRKHQNLFPRKSLTGA